MTLMGMQLVMVAVTVAMTGAVSIRRERVFLMEVEVEETAKRLTPQETEKRLTPQETEKVLERLTPLETETAMVKLTPSDPPSLPALVHKLKELSALFDAVKLADLAGALSGPGPFTLFAPTNKAFEGSKTWVDYLLTNKTALTSVLEYHVLAGKVLSGDIQDEASVKTLMGKPIRLNIYPNNKVVTAQCAPIDLSNVDKMASNGVLHELKALMVPPYGNIAETAIHLGSFTTLVKALTVADLVGTLSGQDPFTVFAPTDDAFSKLDPATLDSLLKNKTALTDVLLYHVANLTYCRPGLVSYKKLEMLNGQEVDITVSGEEVKINNIPVMEAGVQGSVTNGVIHVIDTVLLPPSLHLRPGRLPFS